MSPGSYAVVEDTNIDAIPLIGEGLQGPMAAVVGFLKTEAGQGFSQDFSREAMLLTFNPGGWLKKAQRSPGPLTPVHELESSRDSAPLVGSGVARCPSSSGHEA